MKKKNEIKEMKKDIAEIKGMLGKLTDYINPERKPYLGITETLSGTINSLSRAVHEMSNELSSLLPPKGDSLGYTDSSVQQPSFRSSLSKDRRKQ